MHHSTLGSTSVLLILTVSTAMRLSSVGDLVQIVHVEYSTKYFDVGFLSKNARTQKFKLKPRHSIERRINNNCRKLIHTSFFVIVCQSGKFLFFLILSPLVKGPPKQIILSY